MTSKTWTWKVSHGAIRESICLETSTKAEQKAFFAKHEEWETFTRPAGIHWDGGKL